MHTPNWFKRELELIDKLYFAVFDERARKYRIRKLFAIGLNPKHWQINSKQVCWIPYPELDNRILHDLRFGLYNAKRAKELLQEIDASNARLIEQAEVEDEYISRYMAKRIYSYYREPMVIGGLRNTTDRRWKY